MLRRIVCRLRGHRWGSWHRSSARQLLPGYVSPFDPEVRLCQRCGARQSRFSKVEVDLLLGGQHYVPLSTTLPKPGDTSGVGWPD